MSDATEMSDPGFGNPKSSYLTVTTQNTFERSSTRHRSSSAAPSERSFKSGITVVDPDSDVPLGNHKIKRKNTQVVAIKLTWLDCLLGLFFPRKIKRKVTESVEISGMEDDEPETSEFCPWVLPVYVKLSEKHGLNYSQTKRAQCTIDTGNLQGNIVSRDFLIELGCDKSQFKKLTDAEKKGGTTAIGDTLIPEGAVFLTWYHNNAPCLYRDMRFLVLENSKCDLVIGARSIEKHKLLCPPNLNMPSGVTVCKPKTEITLAKLNTEQSTLLNNLINLKKEQRDLKEDPDPERSKCLERMIKQTEEKREVVDLEIELYNANKTLSKYPTDTNKNIVQQVETNLKEAKSKLPETTATQIVPPVMATGRNFSFFKTNRRNTLVKL